MDQERKKNGHMSPTFKKKKKKRDENQNRKLSYGTEGVNGVR